MFLAWFSLAMVLPTPSEIHFTEVPAESLGIDSIVGSPSFVDYNSDGTVDFWAGYAYINDGTGHFERLAETRWPGGRRVCFGDYDNDGYPDILTTRRVKISDFEDTCFICLYRNTGPPDFALKDVSLQAGLTDTILDRDLPDVAWFDYDADGWLDFYVSSYEWPVNSAVGHEDYLYHNQGDGTFTNVSLQAGIWGDSVCSRGISVGDFNNDRLPDVFVSVYRLQRNLLYGNQGNGTFQEVAAEKGVIGTFSEGYYGHNIGACWGDYDNDGDLDLFTPITHHSGYPGDPTNHLWNNQGPASWEFADRISQSGIANAEIGSAPSWVDYDADGDLDLYWVNLYGSPGAQGWLYRNDGASQFTDVTHEVGLKHWQRKNYALWADINSDGFVDGFIPRHDGARWIYNFYLSDAASENHWLVLKLEGTATGLSSADSATNRTAIGTRVMLWAADLELTREVAPSAGNGYGSPFNPFCYFGLGAREEIDSLMVMWPSGLDEVYNSIPADTHLNLVEYASLDVRQATGNSEHPGLSADRTCFTDRVELSLPFEDDTRITIFDSSGRMVAVISPRQRGEKRIATWEPDRTVSSGVYFALPRGASSPPLRLVFLK